MTKSIVITMGGTGSKLGEALTHLMAAGLGPGQADLFPIDQDGGNGNTSRLVRVATAYRRCREMWRSSGSPHLIDGSLFANQLTVQPVWTPHDDNSTLRTLLGQLDEDDQALLDLLYCQDSEQDMGLGGGYRARPNIGATALTTEIQRHPMPQFWKLLTDALTPARNGEPVHILLMGSLFGGTGAAGFPTLARLLRNHAEAQGMGRNIKIGGVLMLPYFDFQDPDQMAQGDAANVARRAELLLQTRSALNHYDELMDGAVPLFDELYMVGAEPYTHLAYHAPQGGDQINPALAVELVGALGGCRFLRDGPSSDAPQVLATAVNRKKAWSWSDLPDANVYQQLGSLLRLATAWRHWAPMAMDPARRRRYFGDPWTRIQKLHQLDGDTGPHVAALDAYFGELLEWAVMLEAYAKASNETFELWSTDSLLMPDGIDTTNPQQPLSLRTLVSEGEYQNAFNNLIMPAAGHNRPKDVGHVAGEIQSAGDESAKGLGIFLTALRRGCAIGKE